MGYLVLSVLLVAILLRVRLWPGLAGAISGKMLAVGLFGFLLGFSGSMLRYFLSEPTAFFAVVPLTIGLLVVWLMLLPLAMRFWREEMPGLESIRLEEDSPELQLARKAAQRHLPEFLDACRQRLPGLRAFCEHTDEQGNVYRDRFVIESYENGLLRGKIDAEPRDDEEFEELTFRPKQVLDWSMELPDGTIRGDFLRIAAYQYQRRLGRLINRRMLKQRAVLLDYQEAG